jgi:putative inorganic carbon (HCO3(-)) transporter
MPMFNRGIASLQSSLRNNAETISFICLAGCIALVEVSIAASEILLAITLFASLGSILRDRKQFAFMNRIFLPLVLFLCWTVLTALLARDVMLALSFTKKFYLFLIVPLVPVIARKEGRLTWICKSVFAVALISAIIGIVQYFTDPERHELMHRITGTMGHWMTYSGLLMLALVMIVAYGLRTRWRYFPAWIPVAAILAFSIGLSQTRNAAMGVYAGVFILLILGLAWEKKSRFLVFTVGFVLISAALYFLAPESIQKRFRSGLDPNDPNTRNRIELFNTSIDMIQAHPWFGVGPKNVQTEALKYRHTHEFPDWMYQHMHNNILQTASANGIPGLAIWIWLMVQFLWDSLAAYRFAHSGAFPLGEESRREAILVSSAAIGCWIALMIAGMFEYNFGDSEVLILFLFIVSAPYVYSPDFLRQEHSRNAGGAVIGPETEA